MAKLIEKLNRTKSATCQCGAEWKTQSYNESPVGEDTKRLEAHLYCPVCGSTATLVEEWHRTKAFYTVMITKQ